MKYFICSICNNFWLLYCFGKADLSVLISLCCFSTSLMLFDRDCMWSALNWHSKCSFSSMVDAPLLDQPFPVPRKSAQFPSVCHHQDLCKDMTSINNNLKWSFTANQFLPYFIYFQTEQKFFDWASEGSCHITDLFVCSPHCCCWSVAIQPLLHPLTSLSCREVFHHSSQSN